MVENRRLRIILTTGEPFGREIITDLLGSVETDQLNQKFTFFSHSY